MAFTLISNIVNPEVLGEQVAAKFPQMLVLGNTSLVKLNGEFPLGSPGTVFKIPSWNRIGSFADLTENVAMVPGNITTHTEAATVVRGGVSVEVLDTATLVSISDPMAEISNQLARRAAEYIDAKLVLQCDLSPNLFDQNLTASQTNANGTMDAAAIVKAYTTTLGDQYGALLQGGYIVMHSKVFGDLVTTGAIQNQYQIGPSNSQGVIVQGPTALPMVSGLRIHVSDRVTTNTVSAVQQYKSYLIAPEALGLFYQRQVLIEFDRDILLRSDIVAASVDFAPHLNGYDDTTSAVVAQDNRSVLVVRINSR